MLNLSCEGKFHRDTIKMQILIQYVWYVAPDYLFLSSLVIWDDVGTWTALWVRKDLG